MVLRVFNCEFCSKEVTYDHRRGRRRRACEACQPANRADIQARSKAKDPEKRLAQCRESNRRRRAVPGVAQQRREAEVRRKYGLEPEEVEALIEAQDGKCAICEGGPVGPGSRLHIDHDHETGKVRGMLCLKCNTALGLFNDDPGLLEQAIAYLLEVRSW